MKTSEVLNRAADLIEERGWRTGGGWRDEGDGAPLCVEGAIKAVLGMTNKGSAYCPAATAVREYVGKSPWIWNDFLPYAKDGGWRGNGREESYRLGAEQAVETLRAAAVIEAAKETPTPAESLHEYAATKTGEAARALEALAADREAADIIAAAELVDVRVLGGAE